MGKEAKRIAASMVVKDGVETSEALLPRFDAKGNVYGYQRLLDPDKVNMIQTRLTCSMWMNTLGEILGLGLVLLSFRSSLADFSRIKRVSS